MKAVRLHQFGQPAQLQVEELPEPLPGPGELRIRVAAAGINPIDWKTCSGGGAAPFIGELPWIPGWECAGVVDAVGEGVAEWQRGDRAMGLLNFPQPGNCYAEQVCAAAPLWAEVPPPLSLVDAGGLPLAGLTAWQALFEQGEVKPNQRVLVLAAAGGVGHLVVQLARSQGATVLATASMANHQWLTELGCEHCIDYHRQPASAVVRDVDVVIDCVGGSVAIDALDCLGDNGVLVTLPSVSAEEVHTAGAARGIGVRNLRVRPDGGQLEQLARLVEAERLMLRVERSYAMEKVMEAHQHSASGHARGKLLLTP